MSENLFKLNTNSKEQYKNIINFENIENFKSTLKNTFRDIKENLLKNTNTNTYTNEFIKQKVTGDINAIKELLNNKNCDIYKPFLKNIIKIYIYIIKLSSLYILKKKIRKEISTLNNTTINNNMEKIKESIEKNNSIISKEKGNIGSFNFRISNLQSIINGIKINEENNMSIFNKKININIIKEKLNKELNKSLVRKKLKYCNKIKNIIKADLYNLRRMI